MPTFRCPKCRTRLTADGSKPTVNCTECGQLCAIPVAPPKPAAPPKSSITKAPAPVSMADAMAEDEVVDVVAAGDDEIMDMVAAGEKKRKKKSSKSGKSRYKRPSYLDDDNDPGWFSVPNLIVMGTVGVGFLLLIATIGMPRNMGLLLAAWGALMLIPSRIMLLLRASQEGELVLVFFIPFYDIIFGLSQGDSAIKALIVEYAGIVYFNIGYFASGAGPRF